MAGLSKSKRTEIECCRYLNAWCNWPFALAQTPYLSVQLPAPDQGLVTLIARLSGTYSLLIKLKLAKNSAINMASIGVAHLS
ncbi:hypothetical protein [Janthinobacterium psychrotolerans]|uniref:hypothetical protein n=1 Tax=Janthinobacterium psychrotolerans TaxID=1747903 RepID=UPI0012375E3E|nr:hypothetical protein [Janthinobacterium psychrotolerans]